MSKQHILIVGAGAWGASTAVSLLKSGKYTVTLLDRAQVLPAQDAASTDINKIIRFDYEQEEYAELAFKALQAWRGKEWEGMYFESGIVVVAPVDCERDLDKCIANVTRRCPNIVNHPTAQEVQRALDPKDKGIAGDMIGRRGYSNPWGGWADAAKATGYLISQAAELGGNVVPGAEAVSWIKEDGDIKGVKCLDGREFRGDKVIASSGAWTGKLMGDLLPEGLLEAVGITVATFNLSEEEYQRYKDIPVIMGWGHPEFYSMPPTSDRVLKIGLDEAGYSTRNGIPRTTLTDGVADWHGEHQASWLPQRSFDNMRHIVDLYFPEFKDPYQPGKFDTTRMCPIPATFDDNFIVDFHSQYPSLLIASGGSHHSYKMMPIIGSLVKDRLEGILEPDLAKLWTIRKPVVASSQHIADKYTGRLRVEDIVFAGAADVAGGGSKDVTPAEKAECSM